MHQARPVPRQVSSQRILVLLLVSVLCSAGCQSERYYLVRSAVLEQAARSGTGKILIPARRIEDGKEVAVAHGDLAVRSVVRRDRDQLILLGRGPGAKIAKVGLGLIGGSLGLTALGGIVYGLGAVNKDEGAKVAGVVCLIFGGTTFALASVPGLILLTTGLAKMRPFEVPIQRADPALRALHYMGPLGSSPTP